MTLFLPPSPLNQDTEMSGSTVSENTYNITNNANKTETIRRMRAARERRKQSKAAVCIQAFVRGAIERPKYKALLEKNHQVGALQAKINSLKEKLANSDVEREMAVKEAEDRVKRALAAMEEQINHHDDDDINDDLLLSFTASRPCGESHDAMASIGNQTKLEESARALEFLQREEARLQNQLEAHKARCERMANQINAIRETNHLYMEKFKELEEYNAILQENKLTLQRNKEIYASQLKAYRKELKKGQAYNKSEEDIRNLYQDAVERIVASVQEECKDDDLVEEIYLLALECGEIDEEQLRDKKPGGALDLTETEISEDSTSEHM